MNRYWIVRGPCLTPHLMMWLLKLRFRLLHLASVYRYLMKATIFIETLLCSNTFHIALCSFKINKSSGALHWTDCSTMILKLLIQSKQDLFGLNPVCSFSRLAFRVGEILPWITAVNRIILIYHLAKITRYPHRNQPG